MERLVSRLPTLPPSFVMTKILNLALQTVIRSGNLKLLYGKQIAIRVTDVGLRLYFTVKPEGFAATGTNATPDLAISATLQDFYLLATRQEDPDTLFFNRRLVVEGDTELGLVAKNTLDGIELPQLSNLKPVNVFSRFIWPFY
jgi:predicted lipid carrier protein YhbT